MIIYIDSDGRENIIRSDSLVEKLINDGIINHETLLKKNINDDEWIKAKDYEFFKDIKGDLTEINKDQNTEIDKIKELFSSYKNAISNPQNIESFTKKWNVKGLTKNTDSKATLIKDTKNLDKSNFWGIEINNKWYIYPGRKVIANAAAFLSDNNHLANSLFKDIMIISLGEEFACTIPSIAENNDNLFNIIKKGNIILPKNNKNKINENKIESYSQKENIKNNEDKKSVLASKSKTNVNKKIENKFYVPKKTNKKIEDIDKKKNINNQNKKEELKKSVPSATTHEKITTSPNIKIKKMGFGEAISTCIKKYFDFSGRARRSEYWYFVLFNVLVLIGFLFFALPEFYGIFYLFVLIPSLSVLVRRLHDTGKSGWWILISLIPILSIVLFFFVLIDSESKTNKWGKNPKF